MYIIRAFLFCTILIAVNLQSWGLDGESLQAFSLCSKSKNGDCNVRDSEIAKQWEATCEMELKSLDCEGLGQKHPEMIPFLKRCDFASKCEEYERFESSRDSVCLRGYGNAAIDSGIELKDLAVSVPGLVFASFQKIYLSNSDMRLRKGPQTTDLSLASVQKMLKQLAQSAKEEIKEKYQQYSCYDRLAQEEMSCYATGTVVDPTSLFGATFKGVRAAKALKSKIPDELEKVAESKIVKEEKRAVEFDGPEKRNSSTGTGNWVSSSKIMGNRVSEVAVPSLPKSMSIARYKAKDGTEFLAYEKAVKTDNGKIKTSVQELPIDKNTGVYDANFPGGRELLEDWMKENQGKVSFGFIDVNNLGFINKKFLKGREAGDAYLKKVAEAISEATGGQAKMFKLGGDEFGLVIHETDPVKLKELQEKIIKACYSPDVHEIFKAEKILRAQQVRDGVLSTDEFKEIAPYFKEGISMGVTHVGPGEKLDDILSRAEAKAQEMKIVTKEALNIDATKYAGAARDPSKRSDLTYVPKPLEIAPAGVGRNTHEPLPSLKDSSGYLNVIRQEEVYRFGNVSVVKYTDETGRVFSRYERYDTIADNSKREASREVVMNQRTGFIDVSHEGGYNVLDAFVKTPAAATQKAGKTNASAETGNSLLWINTENLGKVNYFHNGTQSGDALLKASAEVIKKQIRASDVPFKMAGSEFIIAVQNISPQEFQKLQQRIGEALVHDSSVKKVFNDQKRYLTQRLRETKDNPQEHKKAQKAINDLIKIKPKFTLQGASVVPGKNLDDLLKYFDDLKSPK